MILETYKTDAGDPRVRIVDGKDVKVDMSVSEWSLMLANPKRVLNSASIIKALVERMKKDGKVCDD